ncbi:MAG: hypothetical protein KY453_03920 [Gemmatimonadetes bacterium]|nr:hypothetical protein [Gemmatimonadota bacterium]
MRGPAAAARPERTALSRELSELLVELSIAVHRFAMYPSGHPSLAPAVDNVVGRLSDILVETDTLSIGVARKQLVIEGVATDPRHPVVGDLARRLHRHRVGAVAFSRGARAQDVEALLRALSADPERGAAPLGGGSGPPPSWNHVRLFPVGYDRLALDGSREAGASAGDDRATQLWLGLAQAALAREGPPGEAPDARVLARTISDHRRESAYDQVIVGYMLQLAEELKAGGAAGGSERVRRRLSTLIEELDEEALTRLVAMGGNQAQRKRFLLDANESLAVDAVVKVLKAAATASRQTISASMTRLLSKLAVHAEQGGERVRRGADTALRENVEDLLADWELEDPNPDAYTLILDGMAHAAPIFEIGVEAGGEVPGAERLLEMALEVDAWGPIVRKAVHDLLKEGRAGFVLELVDGAAEESRLADRIRRHMMAPEQFRGLLGGEDVDVRTLTALVTRMGSAAVDPLLDVLADSDSLSVRRKVFDQLAAMGPFVGQRALERLDDPRWFVQRNILALVQRLSTLPEGLDVGRFLTHPDSRVRREAFPLALRLPLLRDRALAGALADDDERLVRMALLELQKQTPETLVPTLVNRVVRSGKRSPELRAMGARALRHSRSSLALESLLALASGGRSLLGRARLADTSPAMVAALRTLAEVWPKEPRAAELLQAAARSGDPELEAAARGRGGGS